LNARRDSQIMTRSAPTPKPGSPASAVASAVPSVAISTEGLASRLDELLRGDRTELSSLIAAVEVDIDIPGTRTRVHCHVVQLNGNAMPRVADLAREAVGHLVDYAIPRSEIARAKSEDARLNSTRRTTALRTKAKQLLARVAQSGEGGEILLYMFTQSQLGIPQLFCKMPLKTNPQVHVHGIDGIHAKVDARTGHLALYWGESKLHSDVKSALADCLDSLKPFLHPEGGTGARPERDIQLLRDNVDLDDPALEASILEYLDLDHPNYNKLQFRGIGFVGFDMAVYPTIPNTRTLAEVVAEISAALAGWKPSILTHITNRSPLSAIHIELFLLPLPSVEDFRSAFQEELRLG
jgi:hypothetical protein